MILVADASAESLDSIEAALAPTEGIVLRARTGPEALQAAINCDDELAVVVIAATLPGMSGYELAELLRERPRLSTVPIMFMTSANSIEPQAFRGCEGGAVDYILEPIDPHTLRSKVSAFLASRRQANQDLVREQVEQGRLATLGTTVATFAHEVGNLLNNMYLQAQLLERQLARDGDGDGDGDGDRATGDATKRARLRLIMGEMQRLNILLDEFRELARRPDCELIATPLAALVVEVLQMQTPVFEAQRVTVVQQLDASPVVMGARDKLIQALVNLFENAVEAMPEGGTLTVSLVNTGAETSLRVHDTGTGIPDDVAILEPFTTTKRLGTGLGLPVVRQIVVAHAGRLGYESVLGVGTTFEITLPLALSGLDG